MATLYNLLIFILIFICLSCHGRHREESVKRESVKLVDLNQLQLELKRYYEKVEENLRESRGIEDQKEIDIMMQLFIDEGDIDAPFIVDGNDGLPRVKYVSYLEYKRYYSTQGFDTTKEFYISFDSLGKIKNTDRSE